MSKDVRINHIEKNTEKLKRERIKNDPGTLNPSANPIIAGIKTPISKSEIDEQIKQNAADIKFIKNNK